MKWYTGKGKFAQWYIGAPKLFNGTQVSSNFRDGIQVKDSTESHLC